MPSPSRIIYWSLKLRQWHKPRLWTLLYLMRGALPCTIMFDVLQAGTVLKFYALGYDVHASFLLALQCFAVSCGARDVDRSCSELAWYAAGIAMVKMSQLQVSQASQDLPCTTHFASVVS